MASVFLSYDHDDAAKARPIAIALEKAGHSVWWDLHIRSGAQFSKVIEQSLKAADVVVVLWSEQAVESAWVRDEATAGRDTGRLVPVTLDGTEPPLGFRQFQTVDFSRWKGRRRAQELRTLLADIETMAERGSSPTDKPIASPSVRTRPSIEGLRRFWLPATGAAVLALAGGAYWLFAGDQGGTTTIFITSADSSAKAVAQNLAVDLGNLRSVQEGAVELLGTSAGERPELKLEARGAAGSNGEIDLVLMNGKDDSVLWSKHFDRGSGSAADLQQRLAYSAGRVIGCAVEGLNSDSKALRADTLKLYLTGCSQLAEASSDTVESVLPIFGQVVKDAPRFNPAWAKLLLAESEAASGSQDNSSSLQASLRQHIAQARKLDPDLPEAILAESTLTPTRQFGKILELLDHAEQRSPTNPAVLTYRAHALMNVGRMSDAIKDAKEAARLDPTSPDALNNYVLTLAYSGRVDAARAELQRAERLWSGTERLRELQNAFRLRFADPKELVASETFKEANPRMQLYYRTRADPTPANVDRFMAFLRDLYSRRGLTAEDIVGHAQAYGEVQREDDLYNLIFRLPVAVDLSGLSEVMFRPSLREFRNDPRFMTVAKRIGLVDYWTASGVWPDFCFDPGQPYDCKAEAAKIATAK